MTAHHFVSYSRNEPDTNRFVAKLCRALRRGTPSFPLWLDTERIAKGDDFHDSIEEAIKTCAGVLFVMTPDSLHSHSLCKQEWTYALSCKKHVIPLKLTEHPLPFRLQNRDFVDFRGAFRPAVRQLREHLGRLGTPEGRLRHLRSLLGEATRDLHNSHHPPTQSRIREEITGYEEEIRRLELQLEAPEVAAREVEDRIRESLQRERHLQEAPPSEARVPVINRPPAVAPSYFQDRYVETRMIADFLRNDALRVMAIVARAGAGKSVLACRLLRSLEQLQLPDELGPMTVDGIVHEVCTDSPSDFAQNLYSDLCRLQPDETRRDLVQYYATPGVGMSDKMRLLLRCFPQGRVIMLLDSFERLIDAETQRIKDSDVTDALTAILEEPQHAVKVIITTRVEPAELAHPGRYQSLRLDEGLALPDAERLLRQMDTDGKVGLREAAPDLLAEAHRRTLGLPRALEALFAILSSDRSTSLSEILERTQTYLPDVVVEKLVGEAFSRLDSTAQQVMQALAVFGCPVPPVAVDYILRPSRPSIDGEPVLRRLVNMQFARCEAGRFYLHESDKAYALSRLPAGDADLGGPALHRLAADYYAELQKDLAACTDMDDMQPYLKQFDHLVLAGCYDDACRVLKPEVDRERISFWGHSSLVVEKRSQLLGQIATRWLEGINLGHLGSAYRESGDSLKGYEYYQKALEIAREQHCREESRWLGNIGMAWGDWGYIWKKKRCLEQALSIARAHSIPDRLHEGRWLCNLAGVFLPTQTERAIGYYREALAITRETGDYRFESTCLLALGDFYSGLGETREAAGHYREALPIARQRGDKRGQIRCLAALADCQAVLGDRPSELASYKQALEVDSKIVIGRKNTDDAGRCALMIRLVSTLTETGDLEAALQSGRDALPALRDLGASEEVISVSVCLARISAEHGDADWAISVYQQLATRAREQDDRADEGALLACLAPLQLSAGCISEADASARRIVELASSCRGAPGAGQWAETILNAHTEADNAGTDATPCRSALSAAADHAHQRFEAGRCLTLGRSLSFWGQYRSASQVLQQARSVARRIGDHLRGMWALDALGDCYGGLRDKPQQAASYEAASLIASESAKPTEQARLLWKTARACIGQSELRRAILLLQRSGDILAQTEERDDEYAVRRELADLQIELDEPEPAIGHYERALEIAQEKDMLEHQVQLLRDLGAAWYLANDVERGIECYKRGLPLARQLPESDQEAIAIFNIGDIYHLAGDVNQAIPYYLEALGKNKPSTNFKCAAGLGVAYMELGDTVKARSYFEQCIAFCEPLLQLAPGLYPEYSTLGLAQLGLGDPEKALATYREALQECRERQALEGRVSRGPIRYALLDLRVLKRGPQHIPGLDEAIALLEEALCEWESQVKDQQAEADTRGT